MRKSFRNLIERIESSETGFSLWAGSALCVILVRHLLESAVEAHRLGLSSAFEDSLQRFFVHYPAFYLSGALIIGLTLHLLTGERVERVLRVVVTFMWLICLPPGAERPHAHPCQQQDAEMRHPERPHVPQQRTELHAIIAPVAERREKGKCHHVENRERLLRVYGRQRARERFLNAHAHRGREQQRQRPDQNQYFHRHQQRSPQRAHHVPAFQPDVNGGQQGIYDHFGADPR